MQAQSYLSNDNDEDSILIHTARSQQISLPKMTHCSPWPRHFGRSVLALAHTTTADFHTMTEASEFMGARIVHLELLGYRRRWTVIIVKACGGLALKRCLTRP